VVSLYGVYFLRILRRKKEKVLVDSLFDYVRSSARSTSARWLTSSVRARRSSSTAPNQVGDDEDHGAQDEVVPGGIGIEHNNSFRSGFII
jgi:hypothetical protein